MQFHNDILCISGQQLIKRTDNPDGIISKGLWDKWVNKEMVKLMQRGCYGQPSLIEFDSIPYKYKEIIKTKYPDPRAVATNKPFRDKITPDAEAAAFYSHYLLADGRNLEAKYQKEYATNANVLNALKDVYTKTRDARKTFGSSMNGFWAKGLAFAESVRAELNHTLPGTENRLRLKYNDYIAKGYEALISGKFCNDNTRKVSVDIENLLMSIYTMPEKPFGARVHTIYMMFVEGKVEIVNKKTAELFKPADFIHNGKPLEISKATIMNYLNQPTNRSIVDTKRNGKFEFNSMHRPHHIRKAPKYSFSKITMDDRDLPRSLVGGGFVKAYYAYDVASGCVIGAAYSRKKDESLFLDCCQNMFRMIEREGLPMPMEVEVEHHLVNKFFDDLSMIFPFMRICNAGNSQEKHAEHFNNAKKYEVEKALYPGIGRWYAKSEGKRVDRALVNAEFTEKQFTFERLMADDLEAIKVFNNNPHPKKKTYPNKSRWQVLLENINPTAAKVNKAVVYKGIGERTVTSINRNQYLTVQYEKYQLPSPAIMDKLLPNNYTVEAYYLPDNNGIINDVYLYQNGTYICKAAKVEQYNTAKAEWVEQDATAYTNVSKYVSQFDKRMKDGKNGLMAIAIEAAPSQVEGIQYKGIEEKSSPMMEEKNGNESSHFVKKMGHSAFPSASLQGNENALTLTLSQNGAREFEKVKEQDINDLLSNYNPDEYKVLGRENL